jgi:hypothetical protein
MLRDFLKSRIGVIVISMVWGLGLASLFKKTCPTCQTIEYRTPDQPKIKKQIFYLGPPDDPECYYYKSYVVKCP